MVDIENKQPPADTAGQVPIRDRHCVTVPIAAAFIGVSRTKIFLLIKGGALQSKFLCGRRLVLVESLLRLVDAAPVAKDAA